MSYSYFAGCKIPYYLPEYGSSTLSLLNRFGIEIQDLEFNCCGYPVRDIDFQSFLLARRPQPGSCRTEKYRYCNALQMLLRQPEIC